MMAESTLFFFVFVLFGLVLGSFVGVLYERLPKRRTLRGRSKCSQCKKEILWYDNIPVLSYILLSGKCRFCKKNIPLSVLFIEAGNGILWGLSYIVLIQFYSIFSVILLLLIVSTLFAIFLIDAKEGIIPDSLLVGSFILATIFHYLRDPSFFGEALVTGGVLFIFFFLIYFVTKQQGIGFGDVKFSFVIGYLLGFPQGVLAVYFAFVIGGIFALILILSKRKKFHGDTLAFGPFLAAGVYVMMLFGFLIGRTFFEYIL